MVHLQREDDLNLNARKWLIILVVIFLFIIKENPKTTMFTKLANKSNDFSYVLWEYVYGSPSSNLVGIIYNIYVELSYCL